MSSGTPGFKFGDGQTEVGKWGETTTEHRVSRDEAMALPEAAGFDVATVETDTVDSGVTFANALCDGLAAQPSSAP